MTNEQLVPRPIAAGDTSHAPGSPGAITLAARVMLAEVYAGSVDAESFGSNCLIAMHALGIELPPAMAPMIVATIQGQWTPPPATVGETPHSRTPAGSGVDAA